MARVLHYRLHALPADRLEAVEAEFAEMVGARSWRGEPPFLATERARGLFEMEYLRHALEAEGADLAGAGFLKMAGDETDALVLIIFLRDLSRRHGLRAIARDENNPIAKLRYLEFRDGSLASGNELEEMLARRMVIKKVEGQSIQFYPPAHRLHTRSPARPGEWSYTLFGLRAYAPTLVEAEREALKILRAMGHLGR